MSVFFWGDLHWLQEAGILDVVLVSVDIVFCYSECRCMASTHRNCVGHSGTGAIV